MKKQIKVVSAYITVGGQRYHVLVVPRADGTEYLEWRKLYGAEPVIYDGPMFPLHDNEEK